MFVSTMRASKCFEHLVYLAYPDCIFVVCHKYVTILLNGDFLCYEHRITRKWRFLDDETNYETC